MTPADQDVQNWLRLVESDVLAAELLHKGGEELNCLFHLQQAAEKTLKALVVRLTSAAPPRVHNLLKLAELCKLSLSRERAHLLDELGGYYTESRYPVAWGAGITAIPASDAERVMASTKEFLAWVRQQL